MSGFQRATQQQGRLRMALIGPSGSGKTFSALNIGQHIGDRVALIDTERGSASKYARKFNFDVLELHPPFDPRRYVEAINQAAEAGYPVLIVDSLSQAWAGQGGALDLVDKAAARTQSQNTFGAWREVTPLQNLLVDTMLGYPGHLIATIRAKMEHVQEKDERGKTVVRKVGLQPVQRDQIEYEFDIVADMDMDNRLLVSKSRCEELTSAVIEKPGKDVADVLRAWLSEGDPLPLVKPAGLLINSSHDPLWQGWLKLCKMARDEDVDFPDIQRPEQEPIARDRLEELGKQVKDAIKAKREAPTTGETPALI